MVGAIFIGTFLPLVLLMLLLRHSRPVFACFCWGMVAFLLVVIISPFLYSLLKIGEKVEFQAVIVGPPLEEFLKAIPIWIAVIVAQRSFVPFFHILGMATGIGFAIEENLNYLIAFHETEEGSTYLMVVRSLSTCLMHGVASGIAGFFLTIGKREKAWQIPIFAIVGWTLASAYHALFNFTMLSGGRTIAMILALLLFAAFLVVMKSFEARASEAKGTAWDVQDSEIE